MLLLVVVQAHRVGCVSTGLVTITAFVKSAHWVALLQCTSHCKKTLQCEYKRSWQALRAPIAFVPLSIRHPLHEVSVGVDFLLVQVRALGDVAQGGSWQFGSRCQRR